MGQVQSTFGADATLSIPTNYTTPPFPSLYLPSFENTRLSQGIFLYEAEAIWHFTLYWTLILIGGAFLVCGTYATCNLLLSLTLFRPDSSPTREPSLAPYSQPGGLSRTPSRLQVITTRRYLPKKPPLWPTLLIPVVMGVVAGVVSLVSATVIGFALAAVYSAGGFSVSTWVPFLWALIQLLVIVISSYSTLTTIL